ncbi:MHYT domain-containing protein [Tropicimonas sediminicola]|uniref:MHYT domain-containing protein, NO-binding membrane sensor n=1 Tax=Tropicimonas sediminicola TaxID=1031541 RepID=A0A239K6W0_9RHOB|nr:MHYT domain-containing protein [Tropicimonas sediminicola]SNT13349.1 MHYT domain-containing protein, NO-binding membrane sensor [Tropicimonas sediminicola]
MLEYSYDTRLVLASLAVALMAGFTGLSLLQGASRLPAPRRKLVVSMAAICLGGGIWSMHFVAMLGMRLPIAFYYDALVTLISALVAILIVGLALLLLHFGRRSPGRIALAGGIIGLGIPAMHYIGMSGMQICRPVYSPGGIAFAVAASVALSVSAVALAYSRRGSRNIVLGTVGFGLAVFAVHFIAMQGTGFVSQEVGETEMTWMSNEFLAFGVTLTVFVISGAFLLTGVSFSQADEATEPAPEIAPAPDPVAEPVPAAAAAPPVEPRAATAVRVPYEKDGRTRFVAPEQIAAVRAEGHYTMLYVGEDKFFCPWSITETASRLPEEMFLRTHRSYLVNRAFVTGFERRKDSGVCYFDNVRSLPKVPVSRSRLPEVREILGI